MATKEPEIGPALRAAIAVSVHEVLSDPDFGMELTTYAKKRLRAAMKDKKPGIPLSEIRRKYL